MGNTALTDSQIIAMRRAARKGQPSSATTVTRPTKDVGGYTDSQIIAMRRAMRAAKSETPTMTKEDYITSIGLTEPDYEYSTPGEYASRIRAEKKVVAARSKNASIDPFGTAAQIKKEKENALVPDQLKKAPWVKEETALPGVSVPVEYAEMARGASASHIDKLDHERSLLMQQQTIDSYNELMSRSDFAVNSQPVPNKKDFINLVVNYGFDESIESFNAIGRLSKRYGLTDEEYKSLLVSNGQNSTPFDKGYVYLSKDERAIYNYLYNTAGREEAQGFLDALETVLSKRRAVAKSMSDQERYHNANDFEKGVYQVATPFEMLAGNIGSVLGDVGTVMSGNYNPYNVGHDLTNHAKATMTATSQEIIDSIDAAGGSELAGQIAANAYQATMSGISSVIGTAMFGKGYLAIAGAGAASQKAEELYERGASGRQIFTGAVVSGIIEVAIEKIPLDELLDAKKSVKSISQLLRAMPAHGTLESFGEGLTEAANIAADCIIQGDNSELALLQQQYEDAGESADEAYRHALRDKAIDVAWSGAGGFISGGFSMASFGTAGIVNNQMQITEIGKTYIDGTDGHSIEEKSEAKRS